MRLPRTTCLLLLSGCTGSVEMLALQGEGDEACLATVTRDVPSCSDDAVETWIDADGVCLMTTCAVHRPPAGWRGPSPEGCVWEDLAGLPRCAE